MFCQMGEAQSLRKWQHALCKRHESVSNMLPARRYEQGEYYALDIGGTNFRCLYVKLSEQRGVVVSSLQPLHRASLLSCTSPAPIGLRA